MSHLIDRLNFFRAANVGMFADGHGVTTAESLAGTNFLIQIRKSAVPSGSIAVVSARAVEAGPRRWAP